MHILRGIEHSCVTKFVNPLRFWLFWRWLRGHSRPTLLQSSEISWINVPGLHSIDLSHVSPVKWPTGYSHKEFAMLIAHLRAQIENWKTHISRYFFVLSQSLFFSQWNPMWNLLRQEKRIASFICMRPVEFFLRYCLHKKSRKQSKIGQNCKSSLLEFGTSDCWCDQNR